MDATARTVTEHVTSDLELAPAGTFWTLGDVDLVDKISTAITVTGARACTSCGAEVARDFAYELASAGHLVATGGGVGIEAAAIRACLLAGKPTIVHLPAGLDNAWPAAHRQMFGAVVDAGGLVISTSPPGTVATRERFKQRSTWLGAQTAATLIVEAATRSRSLHVVEAARLNGRAVAAVPGPITSTVSLACHHLIAEGADVVYDSSTLRVFADQALTV
ncbi:DNA-processing protein DprA [Nocardioides sp. Bht2]|uniref:DNA-processing protein DprA n=1 Tax=Nocardioides sp. Bht2 TaxID=3392297 RepID=UPI0039B4E70F